MPLNFKDGHIDCDGVSIPMCEFPNNASEATPIEHLSHDHLDQNKNNDKNGFSFDNAEILDSSCEAGKISENVDSCTHLALEKREDLFQLLSKLNILLNSSLKTFTDKKIHLKVDPCVALFLHLCSSLFSQRHFQEGTQMTCKERCYGEM